MSEAAGASRIHRCLQSEQVKVPIYECLFTPGAPKALFFCVCVSRKDKETDNTSHSYLRLLPHVHTHTQLHTYRRPCNPLRCVLLPSNLFSPRFHPKPSLRPSYRGQHKHTHLLPTLPSFSFGVIYFQTCLCLSPFVFLLYLV